MKLSKEIKLNVTIVLGYYATCFFLLNGISGGDLFLLILLAGSIITHFIILLILYYKRKLVLWSSLTGLFIGVVIVVFSFYINNKLKEAKMPEVEMENLE